MAKHFELTITDASLTCHRREEAIARKPRSMGCM